MTLRQHYPNLFRASTETRYELPPTGVVRLEICNLPGQVMGVFVSREVTPCGHQLFRVAAGLPTGIDVCRPIFEGAEGISFV